jgi:diphosphomevalonate decarboxylase
LITIFESGDLDAFIKIVESEALTLHAMMMTYAVFYLDEPNTLQIINAIWKFRNETQIPFVSLRCWCNVHVLYPENVSEKFCNLLKTN